MKNETVNEFYGRDTPSRTYKWGVMVFSIVIPFSVWFKTKKRAEAYARSEVTNSDYAIARMYRHKGSVLP